MERNKRHGILKSAGLLGVGTVLGLSTAADAAPRHGRNDARNDVRQERRDVKEARKEVKQERKDARRANSPAERRDAREDLRDAQRDLRNERQDLRRERREERPDNRWDNRYDNRGHNPNYGTNPGYYPQANPNYYPQYNGGYNPGYNNGGWSTENHTIEGTVLSNGRGNVFTLQATNGQVWQVRVQGTEPTGLNRGDVVRVFGPISNTTVLATGLRILQNR